MSKKDNKTKQEENQNQFNSQVLDTLDQIRADNTRPIQERKKESKEILDDPEQTGRPLNPKEKSAIFNSFYGLSPKEKEEREDKSFLGIAGGGIGRTSEQGYGAMKDVYGNIAQDVSQNKYMSAALDDDQNFWAQLASDAAEGLAPEGSWFHEQGEKYNKKAKERREATAEAAEEFRKEGKQRIRETRIEGMGKDTFWDQTGELLGYVLPSAAAALGSYVSPTVGYYLGQGVIGTIASSATGHAMHQVEEYYKNKGEEVPDGVKYGVGLGAGAIEAATEQIPLRGVLKPLKNTKYGKKVLGNTIADELISNPKVANNIASEFAKKSPKAFKRLTKKFGKGFGEQSLRESAQEGIAESTQTALHNTYMDEEDRHSFNKILERGLEGAYKGGLMGGFIAPISQGSAEFHDLKRRNEGLDLAKTTDGEVYEIIGKKDEEGNVFQGRTRDGKEKEIKAEEIVNSKHISKEEFNTLVDKVKEGVEVAKETEQDMREENIRENVKNNLYNPDTEDVTIYKNEDGEIEYVVRGKPEDRGKFSANLLTLFNPKTGEKRQVAASEVQARTQHTDVETVVDQMMRGEQQAEQMQAQAVGYQQKQKEQEQAEGEQTEQQQEEQAFDPTQLQKDQQVSYKGENYQVDEVSEDYINLIKDDGESAPTHVEVPQSEFGNIKSPIEEQTQEQQAEGEQQRQQTPKLTIEKGKEKQEFEVIQNDDGTAVLNTTFNSQKEAESVRSALEDRYQNSEFKIIDNTDPNDMFAETSLTIQAKPKQQQQKETEEDYAERDESVQMRTRTEKQEEEGVQREGSDQDMPESDRTELQDRGTAEEGEQVSSEWSSELQRLMNIQQDIKRVYNQYKDEEHLQEKDDVDRQTANIINDHWNELSSETQNYLKEEAEAIDFEGEMAVGQYKGMPDNIVHGSHISTLNQTIENQMADEVESDQAEEVSSEPEAKSSEEEASSDSEQKQETPETGQEKEGSGNKVFTDEMAEEARRKLREKLNQANAGADPETAYYAFILGGYHVEKGARKFKDFVRAMVNDIGEGIKPHLKGAYASIKRQQGMEAYIDEMDSDQYADNADIDSLLQEEEQTDQPAESGSVETETKPSDKEAASDEKQEEKEGKKRERNGEKQRVYTKEDATGDYLVINDTYFEKSKLEEDKEYFFDGDKLLVENKDKNKSVIEGERYTGNRSVGEAIELHKKLKEFEKPRNPQSQVLDIAFDQLQLSINEFKRKIQVGGEINKITTNTEAQSKDEYISRVREYLDQMPELSRNISDNTIEKWYYQQHLINMKGKNKSPNDIGTHVGLEKTNDTLEHFENKQKQQQEPTEAEKKAGNYPKEKRNVRGMEIAIENPKGSQRSGTDSQGNEWSVTLNHDYGYFNRTAGKDGDQIDVFLSENPEQGKIFVIDQNNEDGSFDEHKVMMGFESEKEALKAYKSNYNKGADNAGAITETTEQNLKEWLNTAQSYSKPKRKPFSELKTIAKNSLLDKVMQYNDMPLQKRKKHYQEIVQMASKLGYNVKTKKGDKYNNYKWDIGIFNDKGKKVYRDNSIKNTSEVTGFVPLQERSEKVQEIFDKFSRAHDKYPAFVEDIKLGGLRKSDIKGAIKDVREGKNTHRANELLSEFDKAAKNDYFSIHEYGKGNEAHYEPVSVEEMIEGAEEIIEKYDPEAEKESNWIADVKNILEDQDINSLEDLEALKETSFTGFPFTQEQYENVREYLENQQYYESKRDKRIGQRQQDQESDQESKGEERTAGSREDSQRTPEQQKVAEQYDQQIKKKQEELSTAKRKREKKVAEVNNRNTLFDDEGFAGDEIFDKNEYFRFNKETYRKEIKPFDDEINKIEQEIGQLRRDKENAIKAAGQQGDLFNQQKQDKDVRNKPRHIQQSSGGGGTGIRPDRQSNENDRRRDELQRRSTDRNVSPPSDEGISRSQQGRGDRYGGQDLGGSAASIREGGDQQLYTTESGHQSLPDDVATGGQRGASLETVSERTFPVGEKGFTDSKKGGDYAENTARDHAEEEKLEEQEPSEEEEAREERGNAKSIRQSLPELYPEQQTDVQKAEKRLFVQNGKGMLFANATGTGKTYTGLGLIKREKQFNPESSILIVVPSQPKISDWQEVGNNMGMKLNKLPSTTSKAEDKAITITTFANFIENNTLKANEFDMIMYDESHRLMADNKGNASQTTLNHYQHTNKSYEWSLRRYKDNTGLWPRERKLVAQREKLEKQLERGEGDMTTFAELEETQKKIERGEETIEDQFKKKNPLEKKIDEIDEELKDIRAKQEEILPELEKKAENAKDTKTVFLSATPFKSHLNLRYANKYLFDWGDKEGGPMTPSSEQLFFIENFAYRMDGSKMVKPDESVVDIAALERRFADKLMEDGSMSSRVLELNQDYSREFPLVSDKESQMLNNGIQEAINSDKYPKLSKYAQFRFLGKGHYPKRLFEVLKANYIAERIKKHKELGRKVVVYHGYQEADIQHPFDFTDAYFQTVDLAGKTRTYYINNDNRALKEWKQFQNENPGLFSLNYDLTNPIDVLKKKLGEDNVLTYHGQISDKKKTEHKRRFNDNNSGDDILIAQQQAAKEGIDLHDTEGNKPRVMINITMPSDPIMALQIEGRIYRMGSQSNAIMEYPVLGLNLESFLFGSEINQRVGTTENLAMGSLARDLRKSFKEGFEHTEAYDPNTAQGTGGKYNDLRQSKLSEYEEAKNLYHTNLKKTSKNKSQEGQDYFATPEPLGFKMMRDWAQIPEGGSVLEPSAGHGAIARFQPDQAYLTALEPSSDLVSKLKVNAGDGRIEEMAFEKLDKHNKFSSVVMNPPFGKQASTAIQHIDKAFNDHIQDGGRIVALLPEGNAMQKKLDDFFEGKDKNGNLKNPDAVKRAEINLPAVTFERAGTKVRSKVIVIDKVKNAENYSIPEEQQTDLGHIESTKELFERIEQLSVPEKITQEDLTEEAKQQKGEEQRSEETGGGFAAELINQRERQRREAAREEGQKQEQKDLSGNDKNDPANPDSFVEISDHYHTKEDKNMKVVKVKPYLSKPEWRKFIGNAKSLASKHKGYYSKYAGGFLFDSSEDAENFAREVNENNRPQFRIKKVKPFHTYAENPRLQEVDFAAQALNVSLEKGEFANAIQSIADQFNNDLNAEIKVVRTEEDLPERIRTQKQSQQISDEIAGVHDPRTGTTYIISNNIENTETAKRVMLHETVGHKGLLRTLGGQYEKVLNRIYGSMNQADIDRISQMLNTDNTTIIADEYVAEQAEKDQKPNAVQKGIAKIRDLLRNFFNLKYTNNDINNLLRKNKDYLRSGKPIDEEFTEVDDPRYKKKGKQYNISETENKAPKFVQTPKEYFVEGIQDLQRSVKNMEQELIRRGGVVKEGSDVYKKENLSYGKVRHLQSIYEQQYEKPLNNALANIKKTHGIEHGEAGDYLMAVHSLENNQYFREKELQEWVENKKAKGKEPSREDIEEKRQELQRKDYSGMAEKAPDGVMPDDYIQSTFIDDFTGKVDKELINNLHEKVRNATNFILKKWFDYDRIDGQVYEELKNRFNYYVPLKSWADPAEEKWDFSTSISGQTNTLMKRKGRTTKPSNPIPEIHTMANATIIEGEQNKIKKALARLISQNKNIKDENGNSVMDGIATDHTIYLVDKGTRDEAGNVIRQEQIEKPEDSYYGQKNEYGEKLVKTKIDNHYKVKRAKYQAKEQELEVYLNGRKYILAVNDPAVARAIEGNTGKTLMALRNILNNGLTSDETIQKMTGGLVQHTPGLGEITRTMGQLYTSYNPNFIVANLSRDIPLATVAHFVEGDIKQTGKFIKNLRKASKALIKGKATKEEAKRMQDEINKWLEYGGETGWMHLKDPKKYENKIRKRLKRMEKKHQYNPLNYTEDLFNYVEQLANYSENIARFATFLTYKELGYSNDEAAYQSKRVTVNFNKKGKLNGVLGSNYVFFNAAIQGIKRYGELWGASPSKFGLVHGILMSQGFIVSWLLDLLGGEDDEGVRQYDKISDYKKHNYMILPVFGEGEEGKTLDIAMPHILRYFHMAGGLTYDVVTGRKDAGDVTSKMISGLGKAFAPVDMSGFLTEEGEVSARPIIPTWYMPWFDISVNRNFADFSIYKEPFTLEQAEDKADSQRYFDHINRIYPAITDAIFKAGGGDPESGYNYYFDSEGNKKTVPGIADINPEWIEHFVTSYFGGAGKFVNQILATTINTVEAGQDIINNNKEFKEAISKNLDLQQVPILSRFVGKGYADPIKENYYKATDYYRDYDKILNEWKDQKNLEQFNQVMDAETYYNTEYLKQIDKIIDDLEEAGQKELKREYLKEGAKMAPGENTDPTEYEPLGTGNNKEEK